MIKKRIWGMGAFIIGIMIIALSYFILMQPQISFENTESIPVYQIEKRPEILKIAMISVLSKQDTEKYQKIVAEGIGRKLGKQVLLLQRKSYAEINDLLLRGDADIALLSTGAYSVFGRKEGFPLLAMQERHGLAYYYGYVIVPVDSKVNSFADLKGHSFAYVDPLSYSGYLGVQELLNKQDYHEKEYFSSSYFTYSHDASIRAVSRGLVAGATVDSLVYDYLKLKAPQITERVKIIKVLPPMGTGPIVAKKTMSEEERERLKTVILHLHEDSEVYPAMRQLLIDRFVPADPALYRDI